MIYGVERDLLDVQRAQRLDHGEAGHVEGRLVGLRNPGAVVADAVDAQAAGVHPVGADLPANVRPVVRHAFDELLQQGEVVVSLAELMAVVRDMQHPTMHAHRFRRHAQDIARRRIEIVRRKGEADLMGKQLVARLGSMRWFSVDHRGLRSSSSAKARIAAPISTGESS